MANGTRVERTVFWTKAGAATKPAFKETYNLTRGTVVSETDNCDFPHSLTPVRDGNFIGFAHCAYQQTLPSQTE